LAALVDIDDGARVDKIKFLPVATHMTLTALPMTSAARLSPLGPRGVFQIFPQPISIGNMHTLAVFKDR
jgi:hypothetical protein